MTTYETHKGEAIDISGLTERQLAFLDQAQALVTAGVPWAEFQNFYTKPDSAVWFVDGDPTAGRLDRSAVVESPLYRVLQDMDMRLGARHGNLRLSRAGGARPGAGRPRTDPDKARVSIVFTGPPALRDAIDARASDLGLNRTDYLKALVDADLAGSLQAFPQSE